MLIEGVVGERRAAANVQGDFRLGPYSDQIVNDVGLGRYFEAARNGRIFAANAVGATVATAGSVTNPVFALLMPAGGKAAVILEVIWTPKALGTFAAYDVAYYAALGSNGTAATNITPVNQQVGGASSTAKCYTVVTSTFTVAPALLRSMGQGYVATYTADVGAKEEIAGAIIVPPSAGFAVNASASQTAGTADVTCVYAEIDWPL